MEKEILIQYINQGLSTWKIAKLLNITQPSVRYWLKKYDLKTRITMCNNNDQKFCPKCKNIKDKSEFYNYTKSSSYCKSCILQNTIAKRKCTKQKAVDLLGGECSKCGYKKCLAALEFHHLDPSKKDINYYSLKHNFNKITLELDKCVLLCANCHREEHNLS